ncbi:hypothetical protein HBB16_09580 [Pseudonocardia sp. MCCB 268]|nr:hypothetical protein [Pseudonocardia cytotoxica]
MNYLRRYRLRPGQATVGPDRDPTPRPRCRGTDPRDRSLRHRRQFFVRLRRHRPRRPRVPVAHGQITQHIVDTASSAPNWLGTTWRSHTPRPEEGSA